MSDFPKTITFEGVKLEINPLSPGDMLDFFEAFTSDQVSSTAWFRYAMWICSVRTIDNVPVEFPTNGLGVKALGNRIGLNAINAVRDCLYGEEGKPAVGQVDLAKAKN